jgi:hypothetical protein
MMKFLVVMAAFAAAHAASQPESAQECKDVYDAEFNNPASTPESRCQALVEFSKCIGEFPADEELEKVLVSEQSQFCEQFWGKLQAPTIRVVRDNMVLTVDDAQDIEFHRHRRETINVFVMNQNIDKLFQAVADLDSKLGTKVDELNAKIDANKIAHDDALSTEVEKLVTAQHELSDYINMTLDSMKEETTQALDDMAAKVTQTTTDLDAKMTKELDEAEKSLTQLSDAVDKNLEEVEKDLDTSVKALQEKITNPTKYMWSGGSNDHSRGNGWTDFTLNRVEYDAAEPYFKKESNTRFKALKDGLFRIKWNFMHHGNNWCWRHAQIMVNNRNIVPSTHQWGHTWKENTLEVTWPIKANQLFWFKAYCSCGDPYRWHAGWYNRVQITYEGQMREKCTSNQNLC